MLQDFHCTSQLRIGAICTYVLSEVNRYALSSLVILLDDADMESVQNEDTVFSTEKPQQISRLTSKCLSRFGIQLLHKDKQMSSKNMGYTWVPIQRFFLSNIGFRNTSYIQRFFQLSTCLNMNTDSILCYALHSNCASLRINALPQKKKLSVNCTNI